MFEERRLMRVEGNGLGSNLIEFLEMPKSFSLMHFLIYDFIAYGNVLVHNLIIDKQL
jgi:hypothetical protein